MIKIIIVDDELHSIETTQYHLRKLLDVQIVATTQRCNTLPQLIKDHSPDLVFLDIQMPEMTGFEILAQIELINFNIVFVTAFDTYALRALKLNALDYLLKPVSFDDVAKVVDKFKKRQLHVSSQQLNHAHAIHRGYIPETIALSTSNGLQFIKTDEILYLEAMGSYSKIIVKNNIHYTASKSLSAFEEILYENKLFFRPHKSFIINLHFIKNYIRGEGGEIIMQNGDRILVSRSKKQYFLELFMKI